MKGLNSYAITKVILSKCIEAANLVLVWQTRLHAVFKAHDTDNFTDCLKQNGQIKLQFGLLQKGDQVADIGTDRQLI
jgi:hypothetical protein